MAVDGDVAPVANLLGEVGGVEDELWLEERISLVSGQKAQIQLDAEIAHGFVQEACMAGFITGHVGKALGQQGVAGLDATAELFVEEETGEFRSAALLEEFNKDAAGFRIQLVGSTVKLGVANEVVTVVVLAKLLADGL